MLSSKKEKMFKGKIRINKKDIKMNGQEKTTSKWLYPKKYIMELII